MSGGISARDRRELDPLRARRHALTQAMAGLRVWIDLLRHKALALNAITEAANRPGQADPALATAASLTAGSVKPEALAEALAGAGLPRPRSRDRRAPGAVGDDPAELVRRAEVLWDVVADPEDVIACLDLAAAADRLADRLEARWREVRDEWRLTGEELASALTSGRTTQPGRPQTDRAPDQREASHQTREDHL